MISNTKGILEQARQLLEQAKFNRHEDSLEALGKAIVNVTEQSRLFTEYSNLIPKSSTLCFKLAREMDILKERLVREYDRIVRERNTRTNWGDE